MRRYIHIIAAMVVIAVCLELWFAPIRVSAGDRQGTDGTEMNVYEAEQLEINLGAEWAGKEFRLETDAGIYPNSLKADENGVLRTELGGSTSYILTAVNQKEDDSKDSSNEASGGNASSGMEEGLETSTAPEPDTDAGIEKGGNTDSRNTNPDKTSEGSTVETPDKEIPEGAVTQPQVTDDSNQENVQVEWTEDGSKEEKKQGITVAGIPLKHLILFIVGLIVAIDGLIAITLLQNSRRERYVEEYDDYDDYDDAYEEEYDDYDDGYDEED